MRLSFRIMPAPSADIARRFAAESLLRTHRAVSPKWPPWHRQVCRSLRSRAAAARCLSGVIRKLSPQLSRSRCECGTRGIASVTPTWVARGMSRRRNSPHSRTILHLRNRRCDSRHTLAYCGGSRAGTRKASLPHRATVLTSGVPGTRSRDDRYSSDSSERNRCRRKRGNLSKSCVNFQFGGMNTYCLNRSVSGCPTYFPISLSNCVQFFQGRYSMNSADMREPTPGISMNSSACRCSG